LYPSFEAAANAPGAHGVDGLTVTSMTPDQLPLTLGGVYFLASASAVRSLSHGQQLPLTKHDVIAQLVRNAPNYPLQAGNVAIVLDPWPFDSSTGPPAPRRQVAEDLYQRISGCLPHASG